MSEAIRCDRCGGYEPQLVLVEDKEKNPYGRGWHSISVGGDPIYALCPECSERFFVFMGQQDKK